MCPTPRLPPAQTPLLIPRWGETVEMVRELGRGLGSSVWSRVRSRAEGSGGVAQAQSPLLSDGASEPGNLTGAEGLHLCG